MSPSLFPPHTGLGRSNLINTNHGARNFFQVFFSLHLHLISWVNYVLKLYVAMAVLIWISASRASKKSALENKWVPANCQ